MSATVTTGKRAAAFVAPSGKTIFVLFEQTYEKNVIPHTPSWSCVGIGDLEASMKKIFMHASACEGESLQNRSGHITPEGYIRGWLNELAAPVEFPDRLVSLRFGRSIPEEKVDFVKKTLAEMGRSDLLDPLVAGEAVHVSAINEVHVITALYGPRKIAAWHIFDAGGVPYSDRRHPELGYAPAPARSFDLDATSFLRVGEEERLMQRTDGSWYCAGWAYRIVGDFVEDLWKAELDKPGSYFKRIRAYRAAVRNAPVLPLADAKVRVDTRVVLENAYEQRAVKEFGNKHPVTQSATGFEIRPTVELLYQVTNLPVECTTWIVPSPACASAQIALL
jgi:hypothetical protein